MPDIGEIDTSRYTELTYSQTTESLIDTIHTTLNPLIFRKWRIVKQGNPPDQTVRNAHAQLSAIMKRDSGGGLVEFGLFTSDDGNTWDDWAIKTTSTSGSEQDRSTGASNLILPQGDYFIAIAVLNSNGSTTGTIRNFSLAISMLIPQQYELLELL